MQQNSPARSPSFRLATRTGQLTVAWFGACAMLAIAGIASWLGNRLIDARFPARPRPGDLLFELLPQYDALRFLGELAIVAALVLLAAHLWREFPDRLPAYMAIFGLFYTLRAAMMVLTPLAIAHGDARYVSLLPIVQNGNFPSGHAGAALLCYLLVDRERAPGLRRTMVALFVVECAALLLSRSHYSIDIVGGILLAYFVWREWKDGTVFEAVKRGVAL